MSNALIRSLSKVPVQTAAAKPVSKSASAAAMEEDDHYVRVDQKDVKSSNVGKQLDTSFSREVRVPSSASPSPSPNGGGLGKYVVKDDYAPPTNQQRAGEALSVMRLARTGKLGDGDAGYGNTPKRFQSSIGATPVTLTAPTASGLTYALAAIPEGVDNTDRIGRQCTITKQTVDFEARLLTGSASPTNLNLVKAPALRVIIFEDRYPVIGTTVASRNVFPSVTFDALLTTQAATLPVATLKTAPWDLNTHGFRYHILVDHVFYPLQDNTSHVQTYNGVVDYNMVSYKHKWEIDCKIKQLYTGVNATDCVMGMPKICIMVSGLDITNITTGTPQYLAWTSPAADGNVYFTTQTDFVDDQQ